MCRIPRGRRVAGRRPELGSTRSSPERGRSEIEAFVRFEIDEDATFGLLEPMLQVDSWPPKSPFPPESEPELTRVRAFGVHLLETLRLAELEGGHPRRT